MEMMEFNSETPESEIKKQLKNILQSMIGVNNIFSRMPEKCDPYVYYHRVTLYFWIQRQP